MISWIVIGISLLLILYVFYLQVCSLRWDERERQKLERIELRLAHILRLMDAPDVRYLMEQSQSRRYLFMEFSESLRRDVSELLRLRALRFTSVPFVALFFFSYYVMRGKARLFCGRNDLRFLSGLELALFRTLDA